MARPRKRRTVYMPVADLVDAPRNVKDHADDLIAGSIGRFGMMEAPLLDERTGRIVGGHGRRDELLRREAAGEAPPDGIIVGADGRWQTPVQRGWASASDEEADAAAIALNRIGEVGGWKPDLEAVLAQLSLSPLGLDGLGFSPPDLDNLPALMGWDRLGAPAKVEFEGDPDEVPEPPKDPVTKPGDLWLLGDHRLLCGDARLVDDYERVLDGEHLSGAVIADPPYGVAIGAKNRALDMIDRAERVLTDLDGDQGIEEVEQLWKAAFAALHEVMPPGLPYYVFGPQGGDLGLLLLLLLRDAGLHPRHILIWVKNRPSFSIGRLDYDYQHEPIVYGWQPGAAHHWHADGIRTSILQFDRPQASPDHPTTKPVALIAHLVTNSTRPGDIVCDPFAGSGTTLIACHQEGRWARCLEISPGYCDVACARFQRLSGIVPVRDGKPHDFLAE